ncbi:hypothetical protein [Rhizobium sp. P28RR-XV]|uniref:hypothetical protein n=1 Tax=Rhizobium sp. P28RR-XV TaxID=2726737 RepID=UPI001456DC74|nr:hypothetical protein [Rhizobium sp. P28RR-XV]NLR85347.1 hypothetical protein [Rhizobium sp. P28RR-XV]
MRQLSTILEEKGGNPAARWQFRNGTLSAGEDNLIHKQERRMMRPVFARFGCGETPNAIRWVSSRLASFDKSAAPA